MCAKKIAVLTSGGDAPGMNAAVRAVVRTAISFGMEVYGVRHGYNGLLTGEVQKMELRSVSNIIQHGGTELFTARSPEFNTPEGVQKAAAKCRELGIDGVVVAANYNCPGQLVISGAVEAVDAACEKAKAAGARRALRLPVGGAFHSPLMEPAKQELEKAINEAPFQAPVCPVYQNVDAKPYTDPAQIKANLIAQLTAPVRWTYIVKNMLADGVTEFTELGPGNVLQGLIKKVNAEAAAESRSTL